MMELRSRLTELRTAMVMEPQAYSSLNWGSAERTSIRLIDWCVCTRRRTVVKSGQGKEERRRGDRGLAQLLLALGRFSSGASMRDAATRPVLPFPSP